MSTTKSRKKNEEIDISKIEVGYDPVILRSSHTSKYDDIFRNLQFNQSMKIESEKADKLAQALRSWLRKNKRPGRVKSTNHYERDGQGRVWLVAPLRK
jgi:hypothetical protein